MIVLDTNVVSEVIRPAPSQDVLRWWATYQSMNFYISAITQAELLLGSELLPPGRRRAQLADAIERLFTHEFHNRVLPFDSMSARTYAKLYAHREKVGRPISQSDGMIAAIARSQRAAVATRNVKDFEHCGVDLINPWQE